MTTETATTEQTEQVEAEKLTCHRVTDLGYMPEGHPNDSQLIFEVPRENVPEGRHRHLLDYIPLYTGSHTYDPWITVDDRRAVWVRRRYTTPYSEPERWTLERVEYRVFELIAMNGWFDNTSVIHNAVLTKVVVPLSRGKTAMSMVEAFQTGWKSFTPSNDQRNALNAFARELRNGLRADMSAIDDEALLRLQARTATRWIDSSYREAAAEAIVAMKGNTYHSKVARLHDFSMRTSGGGKYRIYPEKLRKITTDLLAEIAPIEEIEVPEEITAMDPDEARKALALERADLKLAQEVILMEAKTREWCGEYDRVCERIGWPGRPRKRTIYFDAVWTKPISAADIQGQFGGKVNLPDGFELKSEHSGTVHVLRETTEAVDEENWPNYVDMTDLGTLWAEMRRLQGFGEESELVSLTFREVSG